MKFSTIIIGYGLLLTGVLTCQKKTTSSSLQSYISSENGIVAKLGAGYNSETGRFVGQECIQSDLAAVEERTYDNLSSTLELKSDVTIDGMLNLLSGGLQISFPIYPGVEAGASASFAVSNAKTAMSKTYVFHQRHMRQRSLMGHVSRPRLYQDILAKGASLGLSGDALNDYVKSRCGDEFVDKVDYGASGTVVVTIDFGSVEAYQKFAVALKLNLIGGIASIEAGANIRKDSLARNITMSFSVKQAGGQPENIARIFPDGLPRCKLNVDEGWAKECADAISMVASYLLGLPHPGLAGVTNFPQQMAGKNPSLVPFGYGTQPYDKHDTNMSPSAATLALDDKAAAANAEVDGALKKVFEALSQSELAIQGLSRFIENPSDESTYAAYFQEISEQLSETVKMQRELKEIMSSCWADRRACHAEEINARLYEVVSRYQPDLGLINYDKAVVSIYDWCTRAGVTSDGKSFAWSRITEDDLSMVRGLYALSGVSMPVVGADDASTASNLDKACKDLHYAITSMRDINLNAETIRFKEIASLRPLSYLSHLESIRMRFQGIKVFPRFYQVPNLKTLDLSYTNAISTGVNPMSFAKLPLSLQCLDISQSTDNPAGNYVISQMRYPMVIMRGYGPSQIPMDDRVESIFLHTISGDMENFVKQANKRQKPLRIFIKQAFHVDVGTYNKVTVAIDDGNTYCPSYDKL